MHKQKHHSTDQNLCIPFCFSHICASGEWEACGLCPVCLNLVFGPIICHVVPGSQRSQSFVPFRRASVCDLCAPSSSSFKLNTRPLGHPQSSFDSTSVRKNYGNFTENHGARRRVCVFLLGCQTLGKKDGKIYSKVHGNNVPGSIASTGLLLL